MKSVADALTGIADLMDERIERAVRGGDVLTIDEVKGWVWSMRVAADLLRHFPEPAVSELPVRHAELFPGADTAALDKDPHFAGYNCARCGGGPWKKFAEVPEFCVRRKP